MDSNMMNMKRKEVYVRQSDLIVLAKYLLLFIQHLLVRHQFTLHRSVTRKCIPSLIFAFGTVFLSVSVIFAADVQLSQFTDTPDPAVRGGTFTYTLNVENNAADTAGNVVLTLPLPATTTYVSLSGTGGSHNGGSPGTVTFSLGNLLGTLAGGTVRTVSVTIRTSGATDATVNATATVTSDSGDTNPSNNSLSQTTTIDDGADLVLTKSGLPNPVTAGANVTWTVGVTNQGPNDSNGITVTDTLPINMTYVSASGSGWSCGNAGQTVTCARVSLANGAAAPDITIVARVTGAVTGTLTNTVTVVADTDDPNPNNTITANVTITAGADLAITKTVSPNPTLSEQSATFTLAPRNTGPFSADTVMVTDTLPAGFTYVSANGTGWTCSETDGTVTCTRATYGIGASDNISIVATTPTAADVTPAVNSAAITAVTADPIAGNNTTLLNFNIVPDGVDLSLSKSKAPDPAAQNSPITSTLVVHNNGPRTASAGTITVTDTIDTMLETYADPDYAGANWTCNYAEPTITCTYNAPLAGGGNASTLTITTTATGVGVITNNAAVTYSGDPGDWNAVNNTASASVVATLEPNSPDLTIAKTTSTPGGVPKTLENNEDTVTYTLTVTNNGPGSADGIVISDAIPGYVSGSTVVTAAKTGGTSAATFACTTGATVVCTQNSGIIAAGETAIFTITASRALRDGDFTNTAAVTSMTLGDPVPGNNSASDTITIDPVADVQMQSKLVSPDTVKAGVNATYVLTFRNNGPSSAESVEVTDTFTVPVGDTGFTLISASTSQGNCAGLTPGSSYGPGDQTMTCSVGTLTSGQSETVTMVIRPNWMAAPPNPRTLDNTADITTGTWENTAHTDNGNNSLGATLSITPADVDILVNKTDTTPAGPDPLGYTPTPVGNDNLIAYRIAITNRGPSLATGVTFDDTITPPAGKQITLLHVSDSAFGPASASATCFPAPPQTSGVGTPLSTTCTLNQDIAAGGTVERYLIFQVETAPNSGGDTYTDSVTVQSNETDSNPANNTEGETTTVRVRADLSVTKTASTSPVQLREPFYWIIEVTNNGPGDSLQTTLTDTLPAGMVFYTPAQAAAAPAPYNAPPYSNGPVWSNNNAVPGSGVCATSGQLLSANFGLLESGKVVTLIVPVRVTTYSASLQNCTTATTSEVDPNAANNTTQCSTVTVQRSSLAGSVYRDLNNDGLKVGAGEIGLGVAVQVRLTGTDAYGNAVLTNVNSNAGTGAFSFSNLSPADGAGYTLIEPTQPAGFFDGKDAAGSSGGTAAGIGSNQISAILLPGNTAATNYLFGELPPNTIGGFVYSDTDNDGVKDGGESGITGVAIALSGTDYGPDGVDDGGGDDDVAVNLSTTTIAGGAFTFTSLRAGEYTVTETQAAGYLDGRETSGTIGGAACGGCSTAVNEVISGVILGSFGVTAAGMNFGELAQAGISGFVYVDADADAFKDAGETVGLPGVTLTLTGTDDLGGPVNTTTIAAANGSYGFSGLRPGTYVVTETQPTGLDNTGAQAGIPVSGVPTGSSVTPQTISAIPVSVGAALVNYNFGHSGTVLSGYVYADINDNHQKNGGEPGIPGVTITISGNAALGGSVCDYMASCTTVTNAAGFFSFIQLPASGAGGYTLTEQPQTNAPLTNYLDGTEAVGTVNSVSSGIAGNDAISGIHISLGQVGADYLFSELSASLSGTVYHDVDDNGGLNGGDIGLPDVTITLSGTTASGDNVCAIIPSCVTTTGPDGNYSFQGLPAGNGAGYSITETQPVDYASRSNNVGTAGGVAGVDTITGIVLSVGGNAENYRFGEKTGNLSGYVYLDIDNDGVKDGDEPGISGVLLRLTGNSMSGSAVDQSTGSSADGGYTFTGLFNADGSGYAVTETQPAGYLDGRLSIGLVDGLPCAACDISTSNVIAAIPFDNAGLFTEYNFGELQASSLSGRVYHDANLNSSPDAGESLAGVSVILSGTDDRGAAVESTTVTSAEGTYSYAGLRPSDGAGYTITETQPNGIDNFPGNTGTQVGTISAVETGNAGAGPDGITAVILPQDVDGINYNFRERASSLTGVVYQDDNDNGTKEDAEVGIAGVVMTLTGTDANGAAVNSLITSAANGGFSFIRLTSGTYILSETHPDNYQDGRETVGTSGGIVDNASFTEDAPQNRISAIDLLIGTSATGYLFGERLGNLSGVVYHDADMDGLMTAGEQGIGGITITLSGIGATGNAIDRTGTTEADGTFIFRNLPASNNDGYTLTETQPTDYVDGTETVGSLGGAPGAPGTSVISGIYFPGGVSVGDYLFGEIFGSLGGLVYFDQNNNGLKDERETGIAGVTITAFGRDTSGVAINRTAVTDTSGAYLFQNLPPGSDSGYTLTETQPATYGDGLETAGSLGGVPGAPGTSVISGIIFPAGVNAAGYLFGENLGSLAGTVYYDQNTNNLMDEGEPGIAGVTITLTGMDIPGSAINRTAVTDNTGAYLFTDLPPGSSNGYTLTETQPTTYGDGFETAGSLGGVPGAPGTSVISGIIFPGSVSSGGYLFGENLGSLSGTVYYDQNNNGLMDQGETGIAGVTILLTGMDVSGAAVARMIATDSTGAYLFLNLLRSDDNGYTLTEAQPSTYGDGLETAGSLGGLPGTPGTSVIGRIVFPAGTTAIGYLFGEIVGAISGSVYVDVNDNGIREPGEQGISGVTVTLSGTDASGADTNKTAISETDGSFSFTGLIPGSYILTESHPILYQDGRETAGSSGGAVDSGKFTVAPPQNRIWTIDFPADTSATGYLFGEREGLGAKLSGKVWFNSRNPDQTQQPGEPGQPQWIVQIVRAGMVVATTTSAADGTYLFENLAPNTGYEVRFLHPLNGALYGTPINQHPDYADSIIDYSRFTIANLTLRSGADLTEQNLPLDPSGVVYDAVTRTPVSGATVTITGPPGFSAATHLVGGAANQSQVTDQTGYYQFLLLPGAPEGAYGLTTLSPTGYRSGVSTMIPPSPGPFDPGPGPGSKLIQAQVEPPLDPQPTTYYLAFTFNDASADVVHNHIPLDPLSGGAISVRKTTSKINVSRGDLVPYTLSYTNMVSAPLVHIDLRDHMPPGFKYRAGSAAMDGVVLEPLVAGRELTWPDIGFSADQQHEIRMLLVIGSGVGEGEYINQTWAIDGLAGTTISNIATASVRVVPDSTFDCSELIGKVFDDTNVNGYQDDGEAGIPNVRIATVRGLLVTTDAQGRFHIACADVPDEDRGSNFILKLDVRTLPSGYRLTTENPQTVRLTRGKMAKLNFGAVIHRVVRLELSDEAFVPNKADPLQDLAVAVDRLVNTLRAEPSVVRLSYRCDGESNNLIEERLQWVRTKLRDLWKDQGCCYDLGFEEELFERRKASPDSKGGKP